MKPKIELLFTLDEGYIRPLKVALLSIYENNPYQSFRIWLVHERISSESLASLRVFAEDLAFEFQVVKVDGSNWESAPTVARYPKEMYFRLLAGEILPEEITKVLYLDPDILVINSLEELWNLDIENYLIAAATHIGLLDVATPLNKVRLDLDHAYYNSGIMLLNLEQAREKVKWTDISQVIQKYNHYLLLPDQDILNYLYGKYAITIPEEKWNYDARMYTKYLARSLNKKDIHWVMDNTSILHFCGKPKPWDKKHDNRFTALYASYQKRAELLEERIQKMVEKEK
ncbi:glycosyltransferase family 8 protein [Enterococcus asini]|uniref:glycosyltransferase family 8 protein n=1 Tax=Enterococcus TaxID=1350 RepID=UPI0028923152|nr:glycosyltransferase family 8 protein [Enterococcus asini]MDT2756193.1 glycosyltransferase family 8 protein [Enterococcus asini]